MNFRIVPGGIYKMPFPFTDLSRDKARPALALSSPDDFGDVCFVFITKQPPISYEKAIKLQPKDYLEGILPYTSYVRLEKTFLLHESVAIKPLAKLNPQIMAEIFRQKIISEIQPFYSFGHAPKQFIPGQSTIPVSGRVYDSKDMENLVDSALDFWLTTGRFNEAFEKKLADFLGVRHILTTNSGSSANLLAVAALTSLKLGERRLKPGDEVITVAAAFPTTVNPLLQYGLIPVFVDVDLPTYNIQPELIEPAVSEKTRAIMLAHTLGNPFDVNEVLRIAKKYNLWVIEDCCDALGSTYLADSSLLLAHSPSSITNYQSSIINRSFLPSALGQEPTAMSYQPRACGSFGHIATFSFYPAHHITMGEGGAVCTNDTNLKHILESFRDWGRDCWCPTGKDNTCKKRFGWQLGDLPRGYDHKYTYSHVGYNLKITDMQAAVGLAQLEKLPRFIESRKRNWQLLREGLSDLTDSFILPEPTPNSDPSWFGFLLTLREKAGFTRDEIVAFLESSGIQTRMLFAGNIIKHPCFDDLRRSNQGYRIVSNPFCPKFFNSELGTPNSELPNTDTIMNQTFWLGVYPGLSEAHIEYMVKVLRQKAKG